MTISCHQLMTESCHQLMTVSCHQFVGNLPNAVIPHSTLLQISLPSCNTTLDTWQKGPGTKSEIPRPELIFKSWRIDLPKNIQCVPPQSQFTLQPPSSSLYDICLALSHIAPHQSVS